MKKSDVNVNLNIEIWQIMICIWLSSIFAILKLTGCLALPWIGVLAPIWIPIALILIGLIGTILFAIIFCD